jgi:hypothetical protein
MNGHESATTLTKRTTMTNKIRIDASVRNRDTYRKHYGTEIVVTAYGGIGPQTARINVWLPCGAPSNAQLEEWGHTRAEWDANIEIGDGWGGFDPIQQVYANYDNHYQSAHEATIVERIIQALDGLELSDE